MTIKPSQILLISLVANLCMLGSASAEIYKWTDKNGKVHFSATPPKDTSTKAVDIEKDIKFKIGKAQTGPTTPTVIKQKKSESKKTEQASKTKVAAKDIYKGDKTPSRLTYCNKLRGNINTLENSKNIKLVRKGETRPLTEEQRASRLKADKAMLEKNCKGL